MLHGDAPVLVDTGSIAQADEFDAALRSVVDVADLRWIWLTHTDFDHIGLLHRLLAENPELRVITTFFGVGIMGLFDPLPMDRVNFVNPGETITLADRTLTAVRPPSFDNPITVGFHDDRTNALFSADCFGALLPDGLVDRADDLSDAALRHGQITWGTIDSSWMHKADPAVIAADLDRTRAVAPVVRAERAPRAGAGLDARPHVRRHRRGADRRAVRGTRPGRARRHARGDGRLSRSPHVEVEPPRGATRTRTWRRPKDRRSACRPRP